MPTATSNTVKGQEKEQVTKRQAILVAALELVVEGGFHGAPMSAIGKLAEASTGVIYHHFASKEEILQAVYEQARLLKRSSLLQDYDPSMAAKAGFVLVTLNAYAFYKKHHKEMRFVDLYEDAGFSIVNSAIKSTPEAAKFQERYRSKSHGGVYADLPAHVLNEMTFGLIARLAAGSGRLSTDVLRVIAERMWESVRA